MNKYYAGENCVIITKKGKGELPLFCGNREGLIPIYDSPNNQDTQGVTHYCPI